MTRQFQQIPSTMKKSLLQFIAFAFFLSSTTVLQASHLMGGEIIATQISGATYRLELHYFRDALGIPMASSVPYTVYDGSNTTIISNGTFVQDASISGIIVPGFPSGVETYYFFDTITFSGPGEFLVSVDHCCRNAAIINSSQPSSESMLITTKLTVFAAGTNNSTPQFLTPVVAYLPVNTPWQYNPLPFDADGDSLVWSLDIPLSTTNLPQNMGGAPVTGYSIPASVTSGPFILHQQSGSIFWTASTIGNFISSVLVKEYRNGVQIGQIRRDLQFVVVPGNSGNGTGALPRFNNTSNMPRNADGVIQFNMKPNDHIVLEMVAIDTIDVTNQLFMYAYGEPLLFNLNAATFSFEPTGNGNEIKGTFDWELNNTLERNKSYNMVFRVADGFFTFDETVLFVVDNSTGAEELTTASPLSIYPNPASNHFFVDIPTQQINDTYTISIYDLSGKLVVTKRINNALNNHMIVGVDATLTPGMYLVSVAPNNGIAVTQQLIIK